MEENWEDFQFSGPLFLYRFMHSFNYGATAPDPRRNAYWGYFCFFGGQCLEIDTKSILLATVDMRK